MTNSGLAKAIVTGATSGIGAATVQAFCTQGIEVLALARRADKLDALAAQTGCQTLALDVRKFGDRKEDITNFQADILVNNAGVGHGIDGMAGLAPEAIQEAFEINVIAPIQLTSLVLEGMKDRGRGHIVNIGSIAGIHTLYSAVYGGTKSAIHRFSQNLRVEVKGTGIRVSEICPGRVTTEFYNVATGDTDKLQQMRTTDIQEMQPADIADAILFAVNAPPHVNIATIELMPTEQAIGGVNLTPTS